MNSRGSLYLRAIRGPMLLITVGVLFAIHQAGIYPIWRTWPFILIVAGVLILAERLAGPPGTPSAAPGQAAPPYAAPQAMYRRPRRFRRSVAGPLVVILIGVLFLLQTLSPEFSVGRIAAHYWPYLLIAWGVVQWIEVSVYAMRGRLATAYLGMGGGWLLVILICLIGSGMFEFQRPDHWWYHSGYRGRLAVFGSEHDYTVPPITKAVGASPRVVIEGFRGNAKITGGTGTDVVISGHKTIRAMNAGQADRANQTTPVEVTVEGDDVTIRCSEYADQGKIPVTTGFEMTLPKGASIQFNGSGGDLSLSSISGTVQVTGHGGDLDLQKIGGKVTVDANYEGMVSLRQISQPIHVDNMGTRLDLQQAPGEIRMDRGALNAQNVTGPVKLETGATDVTLQNFTGGLEVSVDQGDVNVRPVQMPLSQMNIHTQSGDIDLELPQSSTFHIAANTRHGNIENDFGAVLAERETGHGAHLEGTLGNGPDINLTTNRGTITVRKTGDAGKKSLKTKQEPAPQLAGTEVSL